MQKACAGFTKVDVRLVFAVETSIVLLVWFAVSAYKWLYGVLGIIFSCRGSRQLFAYLRI